MTYPGSKSQAGVSQWIITNMPPHQTYIEAFLGSGGGFNQPLADLRARRYITFNGSGENALVAINAEMLR